MAKKPSKKPTVWKMHNPLASMLEMLMRDVMRYERGRYGSVAPDDRKLPASHAAAELRNCYEGSAVKVNWGEVLLSVLVAAERDQMDLALVFLAASEAAAAWEDEGERSHPSLPGMGPGTSQDAPV